MIKSHQLFLYFVRYHDGEDYIGIKPTAETLRQSLVEICQKINDTKTTIPSIERLNNIKNGHPHWIEFKDHETDPAWCYIQRAHDIQIKNVLQIWNSL